MRFARATEGATEIDTPKKKKWVAGLLSALFPGIGHLYAGAMQRGLFFMLILVGNIFGVVLVSIEGIVPLIVLLGILIPVVYFYTLFDALQTTDRMNRFDGDASGAASPQRGRSSLAQYAFIGGGLLFAAYWATTGGEGLDSIAGDNGPLIVAGALILIGVFVFLSGAGKK
ncbi:DUF6677 family protein [Paenibacillus sp.]|uniref:DUF6677 family protein n=1 Tax=Paenibacillus sp. TaxID=58172 RepID=UPI0028115932|nr:DUF6677 family protein [Paenibacillus sp.]